MDKFVKKLRLSAKEEEENNDKKISQNLPSTSKDSITTPPENYDTISKLCPEFDLEKQQLNWKIIESEQLKMEYTILFSKTAADKIFLNLQEKIEYYKGDLTKLKVYGKWHSIPRQWVAYGDPGLEYSFSGIRLPAQPWLPILNDIRKILTTTTGHQFNFVLVNRYRTGEDRIGEHRDDEKELCPGAPIASLSFGQQRDFVLRHGLSRGKNATNGKIPPITIPLEHGSLLLMKYPTNRYWYHSIPPRKKSLGPRINLTFRHMTHQ